MADISEAPETSKDPPQSPSPENNNAASPISPNFDPITTRSTKPGSKRLVLSFTVLLSFLLGLPFLLKSIEIYRSPLPFGDIDSLSSAIESAPLAFPCRFHAVFVGFGGKDSITSRADQLGFSISGLMSKFTGGGHVCGACGNKYTVSVTVDSVADCTRSKSSEPAALWRCGAMNELSLDGEFKDEEFVDEYLESILGVDVKVYTVVVVKRDEAVRAVVGKHRHAWIVGRVSEVDAVENIAEIFVKVFLNGGKEEGLIPGEFMPVGSDGKVVLSFNLLNADPHDWVYDWDFQKIEENFLAPVVKALGPVASISVESQVLYHAPKSSVSYWDDKLQSYIYSTMDLPFFVNSNEWHLDTSIAAGGRSKILQFVVYVPSVNECPLLLQLPDGEISMTNGFISPMWGGIAVWNPPGCSRDTGKIHPVRQKISHQDLQKVFEVFMGQLRQLFGLKSNNVYVGVSGTFVLLAGQQGFTEWELDVLSRQHAYFNLLSCATTLGSLSRLVQSLPRMIIMDEIGKQVMFSLEAANMARANASLGIYDASAVSSRQARSLAEDAFFHPSIMSVSYYSFEHCFAVYSPFFLPVSLHVLLAAVREWRRFKKEKAKYIAWKARGGRNQTS
ncbi:uncharacterized protein LOC127796783 [Diospyros lotus]|uniref:uncharacterized protein LOC127796783 n=1 Tax=Diospyros lotus TaxID=55363 RepID=UPI002254072F|nr:uncharacterized protein LOC127796783 [Diospyros lotus]